MKKPARTAPTPDDISEWLKQATTPKTRCRTCHTEAQKELRRMLAAMLETGILTVARQTMYDRLRKKFPEWAKGVTLTAFRNHLLDHEPQYAEIQAARK